MPRQKSTSRFERLARARAALLDGATCLTVVLHGVKRVRRRIVSLLLKNTGDRGLEMSFVNSTPSSPKIVSARFGSAMMLQVRRATMPVRNFKHATEKSGAMTSRATSVLLSGIWHDENAVTDSTGPKQAV